MIPLPGGDVVFVGIYHASAYRRITGSLTVFWGNLTRNPSELRKCQDKE